jgi:hypothetical protein
VIARRRRISSPILPPSATVEWREAQAECGDRQHASYLRGAGRFTDKDGNTCEDYVSNGWCANGGVGPVHPALEPRTNRTRCIPRPVLTGHAASLSPY